MSTATHRRAARLLSGALLLTATFLSASGCGRMEAFAMVEQRPMALASAPGCRTPITAARGWQYRSQLDMGERPPSSAPAGQQSAISRDVRTDAVDSGTSLGSVLVVLQVLMLLGALVLAIFVATSFAAKQHRRGIVLAVVVAAMGIATLVLGYASGSVISIDNATNQPVQVTVNGTTVEVPARSFTDVRVSGPTVELRTEAGGQLIEEVSFSMDTNVLETLLRVVFGDGRYIYTVCGANSFRLGHFTYG